MKLFFSKTLIAAFIALFAVGIFAYFEYSKSRANVVRVLVSTPQLQSVDIGDYTEKGAGWNAMHKELKRQMVLHPKINNFEIVWRILTKSEEHRSQYHKLGKIFFDMPYVIIPFGFQRQFPFFRRETNMYVGPNPLVTS